VLVLLCGMCFLFDSSLLFLSTSFLDGRQAGGEFLLHTSYLTLLNPLLCQSCCYALEILQLCPFFSFSLLLPLPAELSLHPVQTLRIKSQKLIKKCNKIRKKKEISITNLHLYPLHNSINQFLRIRQQLRRTSFSNPCSCQSL
jgi:hypothetical protein